MAKPVSVADEALKKLVDQLECSICLDSFTNTLVTGQHHSSIAICDSLLGTTLFRGQRIAFLTQVTVYLTLDSMLLEWITGTNYLCPHNIRLPGPVGRSLFTVVPI